MKKQLFVLVVIFSFYLKSFEATNYEFESEKKNAKQTWEYLFVGSLTDEKLNELTSQGWQPYKFSCSSVNI